MNNSEYCIIHNNKFKKYRNFKIKGRNISNKSDSSSYKSLIFNKNESNLDENLIHYKKLFFKKPPDIQSLNSDKYKSKIYQAKKIGNNSFEHFKRISKIFKLRLVDKTKREDKSKNNNEKIYESNIQSSKLPSLNENSLLNNKINNKFNSISYDLDKNPNSSFKHNLNFPIIKRIKNNKDKNLRKIQVNKNNIKIFIKRKDHIYDFKKINKLGYKNIYLPWYFKDPKEPNNKEKYSAIINNSKKVLDNYKKRKAQLSQPKILKIININTKKNINNIIIPNDFELNPNNNIDIFNEQNKDNKDEEEIDYDLMLNDKGTLINFNDLKIK